MEARKFNVGDKVVPISKEDGRPLGNCYHWKNSKQRGYFYIVGDEGRNNGEYRYACRSDMASTSGNYYLESDLIPYVDDITPDKLFEQYVFGQISESQYTARLKTLSKRGEK